jgi:hypothetical protein
MAAPPMVSVHAFPRVSYLSTERVQPPTQQEAMATIDDLLTRFEGITLLEKLIPFVKRLLKEKYKKRPLLDPQRVACGLCTKMGQELAHLGKTVEDTLVRYVYDREPDWYAKRRESERLYKRIERYFDDCEWEVGRKPSRTELVKKINMEEFPAL